MNPIREGARVPNVTFKTRDGPAWKDLRTADLFDGKRVVVFGLPGAFTPTCSASHVPRYEELYAKFRGLGIADVVCISVNDAFVMSAWKVAEGAHRVIFAPDGNGEFTRGMGLLVDKSAIGLGERSWRYAMVVDDGVIEKLFLEEEGTGDPYEVSDADTVLAWLGGKADPDVLLLTKPGCAHSDRAKDALAAAGLPYAELPTSPRILRALPGGRTTPQVFVDGRHLGDADALVAWLAR